MDVVLLAVGKMFHVGQQEAELPPLLSCSIIKHVGPKPPLSSVSSVSPRWTIRARVSNKSSIRTWSNSRGDGKLFTVELVDESVSAPPPSYPLNIHYLVSPVGPLRLQLSSARDPNPIPMFFPGRDPHDCVQPRGGQVLQPY